METENKRETFNDIIQGDKIRILKVDVDRSPEVSSAFDIQSVPTLMLIRNKNIIWRKAGVVQAGQLEQIINQFLVTQQ